jgi:hypothetical protein
MCQIHFLFYFSISMIIDYRKNLKKINEGDYEYNSNIDYVNMSKQKFINKLNKYFVQEIDKKV